MSIPKTSLILGIVTTFYATVIAQTYDDVWIAQKISEYQIDARGPYQAIKWFCDDGRINPPKEPCGDNTGVQRAQYKTEVSSLAQERHIFLGQILASTPFEQFWDAELRNSRLKQYQVEQFLRYADDGWVLRKAQYYRGAFQAEDESAWGQGFFGWLLTQDHVLEEQFFLVRQAVKHVPHAADDDMTQEMRALSKTLSEKYPSFMNLRVKIHGQPDASDIAAVQRYASQHTAKIRTADNATFDQLVEVMRHVYQPVSLTELATYLEALPADDPFRIEVEQYIALYTGKSGTLERIGATSHMLCRIREEAVRSSTTDARLKLLDMSNKLEQVLLRELPDVRTNTLTDLLYLTESEAMAATGCGFLEMWEWAAVSNRMSTHGKSEISQDALSDLQHTARGIVEWSTGMARATFGDVIATYAGFEPKVSGFIDDLVRSSILLPFGESVGRLGALLAQASKTSNAVLDLTNQSSIRGVNPGYAMGELVVITGSPENIDFAKDKIYVMEHPPADMKPVAGIATVSEGNLISHVQLLARNLGIPNAVVSLENVNELKKFSGEKVFYAVSPGGRVIMKRADAMSGTEVALFSKESVQRREKKITVPVEKVNLNQTNILNMRDVKASDSGKLCGPKAANLGQLKSMFPDHVVEGFVIPFGIFRKHMDQQMPGQSTTYWSSLNLTFSRADQMRAEGNSDDGVEAYLLKELAALREAILQMPLLPEFQQDLEESFRNILGGEIGTVGVFLRSDTNMEDLKEFTGAGLNLTLFNVYDTDKIVNGIKQVWASPYTERSFKWRQRYLLNPENVFPSILVIPGVNNDCSGVMITKGVTSGDPDDVTLAFSRGVGGAVEGQAAESYLLKKNGDNVLVSPAREPLYTVLLETGGTGKHHTGFAYPILKPGHLILIRRFVPQLKSALPTAPGIDTKGPFDVELGFKDGKLYLFQARPYVENRNALGSGYLIGLDPVKSGKQMIALSMTISQVK